MLTDFTQPITLGVDVGGTKVKVAMVNTKGHILHSNKSFIHVSKEPEMVIENILTGIEICRKKTGQEAKALGIGIAGQINKEGVVIGSSNLGWRNVPFKGMLEKKLGLPLFVTNDVRAATWGEWHYGAGRGVEDLVVIFVGTGVGGGVISGGKALFGCTNSGGELGHTTLVYDGRTCKCPNKGCLESYVGGWAIAKRAQEAVQASLEKKERLVSMSGSIENITAATVAKAYHEGDQLATQLVEETGRYLAAGVVSIVNIFNPCVIALGGGVIEGIPELIQIVKDIVPSMALEAAVKELKIVKAILGSDAGVIGAAVLAQNLVTKTA